MRTILSRASVLRALAVGSSIVVGSMVVPGCGSGSDSGGSGPTVVASTTQVSDLARNVAGDRANVVGVLAANSDPHDYEPKPSDAKAMAIIASKAPAPIPTPMRTFLMVEWPRLSSTLITSR